MSCRLCGCPTSRRLCRQCEIEERAEERARANARDQDDDDDEEGEDPVPLPDGGATHPKTTPTLADRLLAYNPETAIEIEYDPTQGSTQTVRGIVDETGRDGGVKLVPRDTAYLLAREVGGGRLFRIWGYAGGRVESAQSRAEIEHEHDEGQTTPRRLGDLVDIRDIFRDGGFPTPTTDAEIDRWIDLIESHADDTTVADYLGGIHEQTLRAEFGVERQPSTIRKYLKDDARVTAVLGFGEEGVRRSWVPADSDIGVGEDVACPRSRAPDTGQPCVVCGHAYDRDAHDECPQCANGAVEDCDVVTDGGVDKPVSQAELERRATAAGTSFLAWCGRADIDADELLEEIRGDFPSDGDAVPDGGWPDGDPCIDCGELMEVGAVGNPGETITWQECEDCGIGWGPFTGYVDIDEDPDESPLRADGGRIAHPADTALTHRGVGDQQYCPHGDAACARGEVPCWDCLTGGDDA